jgi:hypothetical protein
MAALRAAITLLGFGREPAQSKINITIDFSDR